MRRNQQTYRNWWIAWSLLNSLSLILGMAASLIPTIALLALTNFEIDPESLLRRTVQESLVGLFIGLAMGTALGLTQERLLRIHFPRLHSWKWITIIPWLVVFTISPWFNSIRRNQSLYSTIAQSLDGLPIARFFPILVVGLWTSGMQAVLLRRYLPHAERWGWMGMGWYALALMFSGLDFTVGMILSFAIANSISGWFLIKKRTDP